MSEFKLRIRNVLDTITLSESQQIVINVKQSLQKEAQQHVMERLQKRQEQELNQDDFFVEIRMNKDKRTQKDSSNSNSPELCVQQKRSGSSVHKISPKFRLEERRNSVSHLFAQNKEYQEYKLKFGNKN
eukprot:gene2133-1999_t